MAGKSLVSFRLLFCLAVCLTPSLTRGAEAPPNFVLVMCDDLGWGDVGFNGNQVIKTPHLDAMAAAGLKLNRFYAAAPVCSPTRGSVVTGRHPYRYGIYFANVGHLKTEEFSLYEALKTKGYRTGHFGKWHLGTLTTKIKDANRGKSGNKEDYSAPWHHQVDVCLVTESKVPTWDPMLAPKNGAKQQGWAALKEGDASKFYGTHYWTGENQFLDPESQELGGDDSKIVMSHALDFIRDSAGKKKPFLAVVWFHAPHLPVVAGPEYAALYPGATEYEANFYGCITALDEQVGALRQTLRDLGVAENTMVAFCSDNGPEGQAGKAPGSAGPFRGRKRDLLEGGVRVPGIIEWPARISSPGKTDFPCGTVDYFPTIMEAAGFALPDPDRPMDGISLLPLFAGEMTSRPEAMGFQSQNQVAYTDNQYKLYSQDNGKTWQLYDLHADPGETTDIISSHGRVADKMMEKVDAWRASCQASDQGLDYKN